MLITIPKWREFNPRKDVKKSSWFRLPHDLFEDPDFFHFTHTEIVSWIYILSVASKKNSDAIIVNLKHAERVARIRPKDFLAAVEKLKELQFITVSDTPTLRDCDVSDTPTLRDCDVSDTPTNATNERTNETKKTNERNLPPHEAVTSAAAVETPLSPDFNPHAKVIAQHFGPQITNSLRAVLT